VTDCVRVAATGAEIVAFDGTRRPRPDGSSLADAVAAIHEAGAVAMADCGCLEDGLASIDAGADCVGTTLAGYTSARSRTSGPDFELLTQLIALATVPVMAEGRYHTPEHVARAFGLGAQAVIVGTAITHPTSITRGFVVASPRGSTLPEADAVPPVHV
jgi:N-acylglucosamine-6-phosphate 2-epimerase